MHVLIGCKDSEYGVWLLRCSVLVSRKGVAMERGGVVSCEHGVRAVTVQDCEEASKQAGERGANCGMRDMANPVPDS